MQAMTYRDIIDDKITEWKDELRKMEDLAAKAPSDTKNRILAKVRHLKGSIDSAIVQLYELDKQETVENTVGTKNSILKIFSDIDKNFKGFEGKTPFML